MSVMALAAVPFVLFCLVANRMADAEPARLQQETRIEADQKAGVIRFIVRGREEARLDAAGMHVRQGVTYGGSITDVGQEGYSYPGLPAPGKGKP